jgi:predicted unusual protein kinase regulating ubiquinone biosynthesis (AarF/ABC1/UbiB family)
LHTQRKYTSYPTDVLFLLYTTLSQQLDMRVEAAALERFAANFTHDNTVSFPQPYRDWTSEYVLTETLAEGRVSCH